MKTQENKLNFETNSVIELNDKNLLALNGGSLPAFMASFVISQAFFKKF